MWTRTKLKNKKGVFMTRQQLQKLISAGVFSAALLSGVAYADDAATNVGSTPAPAATTTPAPAKHHKKHKKSTEKSMAKHGCAGQNGCKGQGGCKTGDAGCAGKNSCKGKGGCATDSSKK
jgi:hypothetical protein